MKVTIEINADSLYDVTRLLEYALNQVEDHGNHELHMMSGNKSGTLTLRMLPTTSMDDYKLALRDLNYVVNSPIEDNLNVL